MKIVKKKLEELKPAPYNPRKISKKEYEKLKRSIQKFGYIDPLVWNRKTGNVVGGNQRLKVLKELGVSIVDVVEVDLTLEEEKALNLALNRISGDWDMETLEELLKELSNGMLEYTGFDLEEIDDLIGELATSPELDAKADEVPEIKEEEHIAIKEGDLIELGRHKLLCGDSSKKENFKKLLGNERVDMLFTDPPYGVDYSAKNRLLNSFDGANRLERDIQNDNLSPEELKRFLTEVFKNVRYSFNEYNSYYITAPARDILFDLLEALNEAGIPFRHMLVWNKNNHVVSMTDYMYKHETILYGWYKKHKFYGKGKFTKSVWDIPKPLKSKLHPTMKPVELIENAILNSTLRDQVVLDCFAGSGSTLIACERTQRKARLIELEPYYCQLIIKRWIDYTENKEITINGVKVNWEKYFKGEDKK